MLFERGASLVRCFDLKPSDSGLRSRVETSISKGENNGKVEWVVGEEEQRATAGRRDGARL